MKSARVIKIDGPPPSPAMPGVDPYVPEEALPEDGVFEIGLVLAGAISAGAYSAGVLDFLIQALDAWEEAKARGEDVPRHRVRLRVVAGASAGAMNGAIAAVALQYPFQHVGPKTRVDAYTNPFYESWVKRIDIKELLKNQDLVSSPVLKSALDGTVLQDITKNALDFRTAEPKTRPYLDGRVRFIFAQGALRGIPYYLSMQGSGESGLSMVSHKGFRSFSIHYEGQTARRRPDDIPLDASVEMKSTDTKGWTELGNAALGSGAFPIGLPPRLEVRRVEDLNYRFVSVLGGDGVLRIRRLDPTWTRPGMGPVPNPFDEFVVDGGTMDNEPLDFSRSEMAGLAARNERSGEKARRAVIMIDPFPDTPTDYAAQKAGRSGNLVSAAWALLGAWRDQARFNPDDLALAGDDSVFSRYLIAPSRKDNGSVEEKASGGANLACGALGGFGGFLEEGYRRHDYLLGRRNCEQFLRMHFTLPPTNEVLNGRQPKGDAAPEANAAKELPIIPLVGTLKNKGQEPLPPWPTKPCDLDKLRAMVESRLVLVAKAGLDMAGLNWFFSQCGKLVISLLKGWAVGKVMGMVKGSLEANNLKTVSTKKYESKPLPTENQFYSGS
ncbi:patatin-like phospholipase family protein [Cupriavidus basilensis]